MAPAAIQLLAWSLILQITIWHGDSLCLKILALRSSQISQITKMMRLRKPFASFEGSRAIMVHHSSIDGKGCHAAVCRPSTLAQVLMLSQIRFTKRQSANSWIPLSGVARHSTHLSLCGHPLALRRSTIHNLFWMASQLNTLHFGGAQAFQMRLSKLVAVEPKNYAS